MLIIADSYPEMVVCQSYRMVGNDLGNSHFPCANHDRLSLYILSGERQDIKEHGASGRWGKGALISSRPFTAQIFPVSQSPMTSVTF